jgi:mycothiol synthase
VTIPPPTRVAPADFLTVVDVVTKIDDAARTADGHPSLGAAVWRDLERPGDGSAVFLIDASAVAHVARSDNVSSQHWAVGLAVVPEARTVGTVRLMLDAVTDHVARFGGGSVVLWRFGVGAEDESILADTGFRPDRELYEMRVPLPTDEQPQWPDGIAVRTFEPGRDDAAWLDVNNRAFANHAEQGGWIEETLQRRTAEAWFDPTLFLLAFDDVGLAGFNWLKVQDARDPDPRLGEIFVVGVDPRVQGTGLGRALVLAGLDTVHARGVDTGMLFCAADNAPALKLYRSIGFIVHRVDRAYEREVAPA